MNKDHKTEISQKICINTYTQIYTCVTFVNDSNSENKKI